MYLKLDEIVVGDRLRQDPGDIDQLAESLRVYGMIQPIVVHKQNNQLVAGGRRLEAARRLGWECVPVCYIEDLSEDMLHELELEENIRRKDLNWKERVRAIARIHVLKRTKDIHWGVRQTSELLNTATGEVSYVLRLAEELDNPDSVCHKAKDTYEAIRLLLEQRQDEALAKLAQQIQPQELVPTAQAIVPAVQTRKRIHAASFLFNEDCLEWLKRSKGTFDHIITDPPYGIPMDFLTQDSDHHANVARVVETHDVKENLEMLPKFLELAYASMRPFGFCVIWCDIMNWQFLYDTATKIGFSVQRWPVVWVKTHTCLNQMAGFNLTKTVEFAMVMRKAGTTLPAPVGQCHVIAARSEWMATSGHPFAKPFDVWAFLIDSFTTPGQVILDPFAGVGTCPLAALAKDRQVLAVEIDIKHFNDMRHSIQRYLVERGADLV
jgi:ParB family chromosome partitioning protein